MNDRQEEPRYTLTSVDRELLPARFGQKKVLLISMMVMMKDAESWGTGRSHQGQ